jgi:hypothetical protein
MDQRGTLEAAAWAWMNIHRPDDKLIALAIANVADLFDVGSWPDVDRLAELTDFADGSISRSLVRLKQMFQ